MPLNASGWVVRGLRQSPWLTAAMIVKLGFAAGLVTVSLSIEWVAAQSRDDALEARLYRVSRAAVVPGRATVLSLEVGRLDDGLMTTAELDAVTSARPAGLASATFLSRLPIGAPQVPTRRGLVRFCDRDLFDLFGYEWLAGRAWATDGDGGRVPVVVDERLVADLYGDLSPEAALGRAIDVNGVGGFWIVGVTRGPRRAYAAVLGVEDTRVDVYVPLSRAARLAPTPRDRHRASPGAVACAMACVAPGDRWATVWLAASRPEEAAGWVDRANGVLGGPRLRAVSFAEAQAQNARWPTGVRFIAVTSALLLLLAALSVSGMLHGKFHVRAPELRLRRALGASARQLLGYHLLEIGAMWLIATALALTLAMAVLLFGRAVLGSSYTPLPFFSAALLIAPLTSLAAFAVAGTGPLVEITTLSPSGAIAGGAS